MMSRLPFWKDSRARRTTLIGVYSILIIGALAGMGIISGIFLSSPKYDLSTRLAELAVILAAGTAFLAFLTGLVALQAYASATGLPELQIQIWFTSSHKNDPVFQAIQTKNGELQTNVIPLQTTAMVVVRNQGSYSARNAAVILRFHSIKIVDDSPVRESWTFFDFPLHGASHGHDSFVQWDGGAVYANSARRLPELNLGEIKHNPTWGTPRISFELLADGGYRRTGDIRIHFIVEGHTSSITDNARNIREWM
jgi:hypothetical protein